ncbi:MAG: hypothetical protein ACM3QS_00495 [Bacteroidota bacterium]
MPRKAREKKGPSGPPGQPAKRWGTKIAQLPRYVMNDLYLVYPFLEKATRQRLGLTMKIPVFLQDPQVGEENPELCTGEIEVRLESGFGDGPTSSRIAVVDLNSDTQELIAPLIWDKEAGWFRVPGEAEEWLPEPPSKRTRNRDRHLEYMRAAVRHRHFHQLNVWAIVQRVLEFYEEPWALGRPVPWGFEGNRLIVQPHAGYGKNAFYDRESRSLRFDYYGDRSEPWFTCLSHDIIAHETGHAILDGIRPLYNEVCSLQTAAFHEFTGDLTAILLALSNNDIRRFVARSTKGDLNAASVLTNIAEQFGQKVNDRPYLRSALNTQTMKAVEGNRSPHDVSEVLTGAMFEILNEMTRRRIAQGKGSPTEDEASGIPGDRRGQSATVSPAAILAQTASRFRRIALQPLDLCPPCDIQFLDYASAVLRNDILTNPVDNEGVRDIMLGVFHRRGLCPCSYEDAKPLPEDCLFQPAYDLSKTELVFHDIGRVSRSRTAAYYFLSDNRKLLRIPSHRDIRVLDVYDTIKYGAAAERLPRQVVVQYVWQEQVALQNDPANNLDFGAWAGNKRNLDCGGTLVFDERGNLLSWFRKPGTEHMTEEEAEGIRNKVKPTGFERAALADWLAGQERRKNLLRYTSGLMRRGLVGSPDRLKPVIAFQEGGVVRFERTSSLRHDESEERKKKEERGKRKRKG